MQRDHEGLAWDGQVWERLQNAVYEEMRRVEVAAKFLPVQGPMPEALTVPADPIGQDPDGTLAMDEAAVRRLSEIWVEFALTPQQAREERRLGKGQTLAIRATTFLAQAQDALIFNGEEAGNFYPPLAEGIVRKRSGLVAPGLLPAADPEGSVQEDDSSGTPAARLYRLVTAGYARLQDLGHYGPYALVLNTTTHAAAHAPRRDTLIFEADRLEPLVLAGLYGTGTLPPEPLAGFLVSLGGDTMDLVVGREAEVAFLQEDDDGRYRFRVWKRFALRLKARSAVIRLELAA